MFSTCNYYYYFLCAHTSYNWINNMEIIIYSLRYSYYFKISWTTIIINRIVNIILKIMIVTFRLNIYEKKIQNIYFILWLYVQLFVSLKVSEDKIKIFIKCLSCFSICILTFMLETMNRKYFTVNKSREIFNNTFINYTNFHLYIICIRIILKNRCHVKVSCRKFKYCSTAYKIYNTNNKKYNSFNFLIFFYIWSTYRYKIVL